MEDIEKSKEDLEREREEIIESAKERLATLLNMVFPKEYVHSISTIKKYFMYFVISLVLFLLSLYYLCKNILLFRWNKIRSQFRVLGITDESIKNHLEI
jgi:hypothetical protein